jgi:GNAT superfamily N-acetyltransferase
MEVRVEPVRSARDRKAFVELPFKLYRDDPFWVPPLRRDIYELIDPATHPFHQHATVELFLAKKNGDVVGRIAAIDNYLHREAHGEKTGFFGLFETVRDPAVARALFDAAAAWLSRRKLETMRGPASFSLNEEAGLLVDGFDGPPVVMMTYNPEWYAGLVESYGFRKAMDLVAYFLPFSRPVERLARIGEKLKARYNVTLRSLDKKRFWQEVALVRKVYNEAWEKNWGHIPMTEAELDYMAKQLKPVVEPSLVVFAEVNGELAGFGLALPDFNVALKHMNGSLFPLGWAKALWYSRRIRTTRVLTLGVLEKFRSKGVGELIQLELMINGEKLGITGGEFSWILEDNLLMRSAMEKMGATAYRTYRMYDVPITSDARA